MIAQPPSGSAVSLFVAGVGLPPAQAALVSAQLGEMGYDDPSDYANLEPAEIAEIERDLLSAGLPKGHVGRLMRAIRSGAKPAAAPAAPQAAAPWMPRRPYP